MIKLTSWEPDRRNVIPHFWREIQATGVTGDHMTLESLFPVQLETIQSGIDDNLVIHALAA